MPNISSAISYNLKMNLLDLLIFQPPLFAQLLPLTLSYLKEQGIDVWTETFKNDLSLLCVACDSSWVPLENIKELYRHCPQELRASFINNHNAALILALINNNISLVRWLIEQNIDIKHQYYERTDPIHAVINSKFSFTETKELITQFLKQDICIDKLNTVKETPLHTIFSKDFLSLNYLDLAFFLMNNGADITIIDRHGRNLIHILLNNAEETHLSLTILRYLIHHNLDINALDNYGKTPLLIACSKVKSHSVRILLENKAKVNLVNNKYNGSIVLSNLIDDLNCPYLSRDNNILQILRLLYHYNAQAINEFVLNKKSFNSTLPLHYLVTLPEKGNKPAILEILFWLNEEEYNNSVSNFSWGSDSYSLLQLFAFKKNFISHKQKSNQYIEKFNTNYQLYKEDKYSKLDDKTFYNNFWQTQLKALDQLESNLFYPSLDEYLHFKWLNECIEEKNFNQLLEYCIISPTDAFTRFFAAEILFSNQANITCLPQNCRNCFFHNLLIPVDEKLLSPKLLELKQNNPHNFSDSEACSFENFYEITTKSWLESGYQLERAECQFELLRFYLFDKNDETKAKEYLPVGYNYLHYLALKGSQQDLINYCKKLEGRTLLSYTHQKTNSQGFFSSHFLAEDLVKNNLNLTGKNYKIIINKYLGVFNLHDYFYKFGAQTLPTFSTRLKQFAELITNWVTHQDKASLDKVIKSIKEKHQSSILMKDETFYERCTWLLKLDQDILAASMADYLKFINQESLENLEAHEQNFIIELKGYLGNTLYQEKELTSLSHTIKDNSISEVSGQEKQGLLFPR